MMLCCIPRKSKEHERKNKDHVQCTISPGHTGDNNITDPIPTDYFDDFMTADECSVMEDCDYLSPTKHNSLPHKGNIAKAFNDMIRSCVPPGIPWIDMDVDEIAADPKQIIQQNSHGGGYVGSVNGTDFKVRGKTYLQDKQKIYSLPSMYTLTISKYCIIEKEQDFDKAWLMDNNDQHDKSVPDTVFIIFPFPTKSGGWSVVATATTRNTTVHDVACEESIKRFFGLAQSKSTGVLKHIVREVGLKPFWFRPFQEIPFLTYSDIHEDKPDEVYTCVRNTHCTRIGMIVYNLPSILKTPLARVVFDLSRGMLTSGCWEVAILVEGTDNDTLPERLLGSLRWTLPDI